MLKRSVFLLSLLTLNGCGFYPYYPLFPTVKLGTSQVSDVEIKPAAADTSVATVSSTNASSNTAGSNSGPGQTVQFPPNSGTLACDLKVGTNSVSPSRDCEVKKAIDYANAANDEYLKAQSQHSSMPGLLALGVFPAAASSIALGIEGVGSTAITGLGVGTAMGLGLGAYLHTPDREKVYNTGSLGIQCMLENMEPYTRISNNDLYVLGRLLDSGDAVTPNDYGDESDMDLAKAKTQLDLQINKVEALGLQKNCQRLPRVMQIASLLLKAAKASDNSAAKTIQVGSEFARTALAAPITIVNTTNHINAALNGALIQTEPSISALASNVKSTIPDSKEQALAGLSAAKTAAADAQAKTEDATGGSGGAPKGPAKGAAAPSGGTENITGFPLSSNTVLKSMGNSVEMLQVQPPAAPGGPQTQTPVGNTLELKPPGLTPEEVIQVVELERAIFTVNELVSRVMYIVGSNTGKVDNGKCPVLTEKTGKPAVMKLIPADDIPVPAGTKTVIAVAGATNPYTRPLFPQTVCTAVTATLKANEIDVAAADNTTPGFYPFFAGDGATGRIFNAYVTSKPAADNTDEVQACEKGDPGFIPEKKSKKKQIGIKCPPPSVFMLPPVSADDAGHPAVNGNNMTITE